MSRPNYTFTFTPEDSRNAFGIIISDMKKLPSSEMFIQPFTQAKYDMIYASDDMTSVVQQLCTDKYIKKLRAKIRHENYKYKVDSTKARRLTQNTIKNLNLAKHLLPEETTDAEIIERAVKMYYYDLLSGD